MIDIYDAIDSHDAKELIRLLSAGADPNQLVGPSPGWHPLQLAVGELEFGGSADMLVVLLRHGARTELHGGDSTTALLMSVMAGQLEAVRVLLAAGADPCTVGPEGDSPLRWAAEHSHLEMATLLLRTGAIATINEARGARGMTALGRAVSNADVPMVRLLLNFGADPAVFDCDGQRALDHLPPVSVDNQERLAELVSLLSSQGLTRK